MPPRALHVLLGRRARPRGVKTFAFHGKRLALEPQTLFRQRSRAVCLFFAFFHVISLIGRLTI